MTFNLTIPGPGVAYEQVGVGTSGYPAALAVAKSQPLLDQLHSEGYLAAAQVAFAAGFAPDLAPGGAGTVQNFFGGAYFATQANCDKLNAVYAALAARHTAISASNGGYGTFTSVDATTLKFKPALHEDAFSMAVELLYSNGTDTLEQITDGNGTVIEEILHWNRVAVALRNLTLNVGAYGGHGEVPRVVIDKTKGFLFGQRTFGVGAVYYPLTLPVGYDAETWELLTKQAAPNPTDGSNAGIAYPNITAGDDLRSWLTHSRIWSINGAGVVSETTTADVTADYYLSVTADTPELVSNTTYIDNLVAWFDGTAENFGEFHPEDKVSIVHTPVTAPKVEDGGATFNNELLHNLDLSELGLYFGVGDPLSTYFALTATHVSGDERAGMGFQYDNNAQLIDPDEDSDTFHNAKLRVTVGTTDYDTAVEESVYSFTVQNVDPADPAGTVGPVSAAIEVTFPAFTPA